MEEQQIEKVSEPLSFATRYGLTLQSFKPAKKDDTTSTLTKKHKDIEDGIPEEHVLESNLQQGIKKRHLHMIAIGGSIGTGLFVGSGLALARGGPASLLICFALTGFMLFNVVYALGELAIIYPISGGIYTYSTRFIDKSWGFAMGYNYVLQWLVVLPLEITAAGLTVEYWQVNAHIALWITLFWVIIIILSLFGVWMYGEEEFWSSCLKLLAVVMFIIAGIVLNCGGGLAGTPYDTYVGFRYWENPGAFANGFKGFCSVFVTAAFAFAGTEVVGLAAAETPNPRKSLPRAVKQVFWRVTVFYILSLFIVGLLVPYNDPRLLSAESSADVKASPFVIALTTAGLTGFDSFFNVVILISVISIGFSAVFAGSRTLTALAENGYAPKFFATVDRAGRPTWSTAFILAFGALAYMNVSASGEEVFGWLMALSGLSTLFTWGSVCFAHIRFRWAWESQGHSVDELAFKAAFGIYGSFIGLSLIILVLIAQFYVALFPLTGEPSAEAFFYSYLAFPIVIIFYIAGYIWKYKSGSSGWLRLQDIDLDSGRKTWFTAEELKAERDAMPPQSLPLKIFNWFC